jgi:hypothetical protein
MNQPGHMIARKRGWILQFAAATYGKMPAVKWN